MEKIEDLKIVEPSFIKKVLMVLISNVDLNQNLLDKLFKITIDASIKSTDATDFFLATKLSSEKDYFNSFSLLFKIVGDRNLMQINFSSKLLSFNNTQKFGF